GGGGGGGGGAVSTTAASAGLQPKLSPAMMSWRSSRSVLIAGRRNASSKRTNTPSWKPGANASWVTAPWTASPPPFSWSGPLMSRKYPPSAATESSQPLSTMLNFGPAVNENVLAGLPPWHSIWFGPAGQFSLGIRVNSGPPMSEMAWMGDIIHR